MQLGFPSVEGKLSHIFRLTHNRTYSDKYATVRTRAVNNEICPVLDHSQGVLTFAWHSCGPLRPVRVFQTFGEAACGVWRTIPWPWPAECVHRLWVVHVPSNPVKLRENVVNTITSITTPKPPKLARLLTFVSLVLKALNLMDHFVPSMTKFAHYHGQVIRRYLFAPKFLKKEFWQQRSWPSFRMCDIHVRFFVLNFIRNFVLKRSKHEQCGKFVYQGDWYFYKFNFLFNLLIRFNLFKMVCLIILSQPVDGWKKRSNPVSDTFFMLLFTHCLSLVSRELHAKRSLQLEGLYFRQERPL